MENEEIVIGPVVKEEKAVKAAPKKAVKAAPKEENEEVIYNEEALNTAKEINEEGKVRIKIPKDPLNPKDLMVPVSINGYIYNIKRGETVTVPEAVAEILEEANYI